MTAAMLDIVFCVDESRFVALMNEAIRTSLGDPGGGQTNTMYGTVPLPPWWTVHSETGLGTLSHFRYYFLMYTHKHVCTHSFYKPVSWFLQGAGGKGSV